MSKNDFNLQPMQEFLAKDVDLSFIINQLDAIYYEFTTLAMLASAVQDQPIYESTIENRYWIERLKSLFLEMQN